MKKIQFGERELEMFEDLLARMDESRKSHEDGPVVDAVLLDPHERVIDVRRVKDLLSSMESDAIIRGGQALMERWGELKKELGIE